MILDFTEGLLGSNGCKAVSKLYEDGTEKADFFGASSLSDTAGQG